MNEGKEQESKSISTHATIKKMHHTEPTGLHCSASELDTLDRVRVNGAGEYDPGPTVGPVSVLKPGRGFLWVVVNVVLDLPGLEEVDVIGSRPAGTMQ